MPDKVPLWIIKNTFCPYGNRMPARPDTLSPDLEICNTCQKELYNFRDWNYCNGEYYCNTCITAVREEARKKWAGAYNIVPFRSVPRIEPEIPDGNLPENDYVFWIGNTETYSGGSKSLRATCRACGQEVFGEVSRSGHRHTSTVFYAGGLSCAKVLMLCYQQLLKLDICLVCGIKSFGKQKWGVPLCSPECIKHWKFNESVTYPLLEKAITQFWATETGGCTTSESTSSQTSMSTPEQQQE